VNGGDVVEARSLLEDEDVTGVAWRNDGSLADLVAAAADGYAEYVALAGAGAPAADVFAAFRRFRVLCAHRRGPWGVEAVNQAIDREIRRRLVVESDVAFYPSRPVLVTQNDYALGLFNGDVGIALADDEAPERVRIVFETSRGVRRLTPGRLPLHEAVWATTVHKSQGSEFDRVLLVLPSEDSPLVTRELVYTGITRSRGQVEIWGSETVLDAGLGRRLARSSGLREALWS
jgi:exodeoxyribonuclease V alpha subunit